VSPLLLVLVIVLIAVTTSAVTIIAATLKTGTPPMPVSPVVLPTLTSVVARACGSEHSRGRLEPEEEHRPSPRIIDGGSGWGTILRTLADALPQASLTGVERSPVPCLVSGLRPSLLRRGVRVHCGDLFAEAFQHYDVLVVYLSSTHMNRLAGMTDRLPPTLVSVAFALPGHTPVLERRAADIYRTPVYLYRF